MKLVVIFITGYSGHSKSHFDDELIPAFEPSPHDLLDNLFVSGVCNEIGRDFLLPVTLVIPLTKSLFDDELTSVFEPSPHDLLDNLFVS